MRSAPGPPSSAGRSAPCRSFRSTCIWPGTQTRAGTAGETRIRCRNRPDPALTSQDRRQRTADALLQVIERPLRTVRMDLQGAQRARRCLRPAMPHSSRRARKCAVPRRCRSCGATPERHDRGRPPRMNSPTDPSTTGSRPVARANSAASVLPSPHGDISSSVAARYSVWYSAPRLHRINE